MTCSFVVNPVVRKYARAFCNIYGEKFDTQNIKKLEHLIDYLRQNRSLFVYANMPAVTSQDKISAFIKVCNKFDVLKEVELLLSLLINQGRIDLFPQVLSLFVLYFRRSYNIVVCKVTTSVELDNNQKKQIKKMLHLETGAEVIADFFVSSKLIKGIRIQSDDMLWECSVARRLKILERTVLQRV